MLRIITILLLALAAGPAQAYVGPGAGISVLGSLLGILATILVAIGAIVFWPVRKLLKRRKAAAAAAETTESSAADSTPQR
jgi:disulfide bond formation protein DsbB